MSHLSPPSYLFFFYRRFTPYTSNCIPWRYIRAPFTWLLAVTGFIILHRDSSLGYFTFWKGCSAQGRINVLLIFEKAAGVWGETAFSLSSLSCFTGWILPFYFPPMISAKLHFPVFLSNLSSLGWISFCCLVHFGCSYFLPTDWMTGQPVCKEQCSDPFFSLCLCD